MPDFVQRAVAAAGLILSLPVQLVLVILVKLESPGPAIYRARRVGGGGVVFTCFKLRTMAWQKDAAGPAVTVDGDPRVTRIGRVLRRFRLDEVPQLINVVRGEMNLVGPRPEDPRFVDLDQPLHRTVFMARPGIAGLAQLAFHDEARLLAGAADPDELYRRDILPRKLKLDAAYLDGRSWLLDLWILGRTALVVLGRRPSIAGAPLRR
jgi:lipopolysaccharide/colanic/teichoic acid biosynthesis glycosyltransferase